MRVTPRRATASIAAAMLIATLALPAMAQEESPTPAESATTWPITGPLKDGSTFTLKQSIQDKLALNADDDPANDVPINYVFSYGSSAIALFSPQYLAGFERSIPEAQAILPQLVGTAIAPATARQEPLVQIPQIEALYNAGLIDCLSIQTTGEDAFTQIVNNIMADGIPVWTVGVQSNGNELTNFTQISLKEGAQAAEIVADWMERTGNDLKVFAVSGGDPAQNWAQGRMKGFVDRMKELKPDVEFRNTEVDGLNVSYDPAATYDAYRAFIQGNPDVQFIENVDIGAEYANRAIVDAGKEGETFTIGWNVSEGQLDGVEQGIQVAALDQRWSDQAAFGATACAEFLTDGTIHENTQTLLPWTVENIEEAREEFAKVS
jgi:ribose transport system substrate-binding protein